MCFALRVALQYRDAEIVVVELAFCVGVEAFAKATILKEGTSPIGIC